MGGVRELENSIHLSFHIVVVFISSGCFHKYAARVDFVYFYVLYVHIHRDV